MASRPSLFKCVILMIATLMAAPCGAQEVEDQRTYILATGRGDVPAAVEFGRVAAAPVNTLRQQTHRCQEISVCF